jgi:hypothetical protein
LVTFTPTGPKPTIGRLSNTHVGRTHLRQPRVGRIAQPVEGAVT